MGLELLWAPLLSEQDKKFIGSKDHGGSRTKRIYAHLLWTTVCEEVPRTVSTKLVPYLCWLP